MEADLLDACTRLVRANCKMMALHTEDMKLLEQLKVKPEAAYYLERTHAATEVAEAGKALLSLLEAKSGRA